jgi:hypothetical protein
MYVCICVYIYADMYVRITCRKHLQMCVNVTYKVDRNTHTDTQIIQFFKVLPGTLRARTCSCSSAEHIPSHTRSSDCSLGAWLVRGLADVVKLHVWLFDANSGCCCSIASAFMAALRLLITLILTETFLLLVIVMFLRSSSVPRILGTDALQPSVDAAVTGVRMGVGGHDDGDKGRLRGEGFLDVGGVAIAEDTVDCFSRRAASFFMAACFARIDFLAFLNGAVIAGLTLA